MRRLLLSAAALVAASAVTFTHSFAADTSEAKPAAEAATANPVVATVNGQPVRLTELEAARQRLPEQYRQMPLQMLFEPLLGQVIDGKLLLREAEQRKLADLPEVKEALAQAREEVLRDQMLQQAIVEGMTEERLQQAYKEMSAAPGFAYEEVHARHILLESEDEARQVIASIEGGAGFAELARERSIDPSAKDNEGDLGYFRREAMVAPFAEAAFGIEPGTVSGEPVETQFGWHVIKVEDKRQTVPSFEEKEPELRDKVAREIATGLLEEVREGAKIERFNLDGSPRAQ